MKHRFYISTENIHESEVIFSESQRNKISRVLRLKHDDTVMVSDGIGNNFVVHAGSGKIIEKQTVSRKKPVKVRALIGITKLPAFETALQKAVEIGVDEIVPVITGRSVVRLQDTEKKHSRFVDIVINAFCQCKRNFMPIIQKVLKNIESIPEYNGVKIVFYEDETKKELKQILEENSGAQEITLFFGPEGGFSKDEIDFLVKNGFQSGRLTENTLRAETAVIFALANVNFFYGL